MRCFYDFKSGGGLCTILSVMYRYKTEQRWRKFDFMVRLCVLKSMYIIVLPVKNNSRIKEEKNLLFKC